MPTTFLPHEPDQLLLAPDVRDWLAEGHLAHHVSDLADGLDLTAFYAPYEGDGRRNAPYEPRMMVKVLRYGYATGIFSSRGIARKLATPAGRGRYAQCKWLSEAPNGWIKEVLGFRRFSVRSLNKARGEWDLVWLALNIKRLQPLLAV